MSCEPPFWKDISIIGRDFSLQYKPVCEHSVWNFIARFLILSVCLGLIASAVGGLTAFMVTLLCGIIIAFVIVAMTPTPIKKNQEQKHHVNHEETKKELSHSSSKDYHELPYTATVQPTMYPPSPATTEHFVNGGSTMGSVQPTGSPIGIIQMDAAPYSGSPLPEFTPPTSRNLFMNVLVDEMKYNPDRPEAAPVGHPTIKQTLDDFFRIQWFSDPTDVFGKNQGQRQFVTQPSTTIPNDQGSFANWLYKIPGKTCKEGGREACVSSTDGGQFVWLNQD
jgi:hypothetical protein